MEEIDKLLELDKYLKNEKWYSEETFNNFFWKSFSEFFFYTEKDLNKYNHDAFWDLGNYIGKLTNYLKVAVIDDFINITQNPIRINTKKSLDAFLNLHDYYKIENLMNRVFSEWEDKASENGVDLSIAKNGLLSIQKELSTNLKQLEIFKKQINFIYSQSAKIYDLYYQDISDDPSDFKNITSSLLDYINNKEFLYNNKEFMTELAGNSLGIKYTSIFPDLNSKVIEPIKECFKEKNISLSQAESFVKASSKKGDITGYLNSKLASDNLSFSIKMTKSQQYSEVSVFSDGSIALKKSDDTLITPDNHLHCRMLLREVFNDYISFKLRKKPALIKPFQELLKNESYNINGAFLTIDSFLKNEAILKQEKFNILDILKGSRFEDIDDLMHRTIRDFKVKQYAHSIASNKYFHLYDEKSYSILKNIQELNIPEKTLQDIIGKKMASFENSEKFNEALTTYLNSINGFNFESINEKCKHNNASIVLNFDNILVVKINDFEASKALGISSWCISRDNYYFNSYTGKGEHQYFIYNFNKDSNDNHSMIGITINSDGTYYTGHIKNDDVVEYDHDIENIHLKIIQSSKNVYTNLDTTIQAKIDEIENKKEKNIETIKNKVSI